MDSELEKCPLCIANGGRFTKSAHCCQVRKTADAPAHSHAGVFEAMRLRDGKHAVNQFIRQVNAELAHRRERKTKMVDQARATMRRITGAGSGNSRRRVEGYRCAGKGRDS